jgi:hypothetical protein
MNCPHHIQWVIEAPAGLHQCLQCFDAVAKKDITPRFEDLGADLQKRWDAHEARGATSATSASP